MLVNLCHPYILSTTVLSDNNGSAIALQRNIFQEKNTTNMICIA